MSLNTLSGRFALLTCIFVLLAELLILLPSIANYRLDFLESRLERAQIASLALLATDESLATDLESELLENAGVFNVVLRRESSAPAHPVAFRSCWPSSPVPDGAFYRINGALRNYGCGTASHIIRFI